jgi:hypothetical protein
MPGPLTPLAQQAAAHHEAFRAWVDAGFTEEQAMDLLKTVMVVNAQGERNG